MLFVIAFKNVLVLQEFEQNHGLVQVAFNFAVRQLKQVSNYLYIRGTDIFAALFEVVVQEDGQILGIFGVKIKEECEVVLDCPLEVLVVSKRLLHECVKLVFEVQ
jgi:hypothetical protein